LEEQRRFKIAIGGRGGAKSRTFAMIFAMKAHAERALISCFREYQNSIEDSVYPLIRSCIEDYGLPGFEIGKSSINHMEGGGFRFKGLARSIDGIKSMHGTNYFWVEEGQFLSADSLRILTPTLREEKSELWISANPMSYNDPFSQRFIVPFERQLAKDGYYLDDLHLIVKINYSDNPWFPAVLEQERRFDYTNLPRALYDHIWEGAFNDSVENSIIPTEWFDACIDAHKKLGFQPQGAIIVSHDPSDLGTDDKSVVRRHGSVVLDARLKKYGDVNEGCDWATSYAIEHGADTFIWDADGMGVSLRRQVVDSLKGKKIRIQPFRGSLDPEDPGKIYDDGGRNILDRTAGRKNGDVFRNRRAQMYWRLRDRMYNTYRAVTKGQYIDPEKLISISKDISVLPLLRSETCRVPRKFLGSGLIQIMNKAEMRRLKIQSPNLADALMMAMVQPHTIEDRAPMEFDSLFV